MVAAHSTVGPVQRRLVLAVVVDIDFHTVEHTVVHMLVVAIHAVVDL